MTNRRFYLKHGKSDRSYVAVESAMLGDTKDYDEMMEWCGVLPYDGSYRALYFQAQGRLYDTLHETHQAREAEDPEAENQGAEMYGSLESRCPSTGQSLSTPPVSQLPQ